MSHVTALRAAFLLASLASLAATGPASACPSCPVGREARARVWDDDFGVNLSLALAPFVIVGSMSVWANRLGRPSTRFTGPGPHAQ